MSVQEHLPPGFHTITSSLTVHDSEAAIEFYKEALGAELVIVVKGPGGKGVAHAEMRIGDSHFFLNDEFPQGITRSPQTLGGVTSALQLYVSDCDAAYRRAVDAGAKSKMPPMDMFWGDRMSQVVDPFGQVWGISTRKEHLSEDELRERTKAFWKSHTGGEE